jgi:ubiquinone/menaquinone biosynthesis C-methylase UbiE
MKIVDQIHPSYDDLRPLLVEHSPDEYYKYIFQFSMDQFHQRVDMVGFTDADHVLDAGCGYGQWSVALAEANRRVSACDRDPGMLRIAAAVAQRGGVADRIDLRSHDLNSPLPYADASFDAVWCWGVIMFVDRDLALREFNRVLRPGGRLLLGAVNSTGRWARKLVAAANPLRCDKMVVNMSLRALRRGRRFDAFPSLLTRRMAPGFLKHYGFEVLAVGVDGHIDTRGRGRRLSMFPPRYLGIENNIEVLARKSEPTARAE